MPGPPTFGHSLAPGADAQAVAEVLDRIESYARRGGLAPPTLDRVVIVTGELISNAAEHGRTSISLSWTPVGQGGRLDVHGGTEVGLAAIVGSDLPDAASTRGRGLFLIRELSDEIVETATGLRVAFERRVGE